MNPLSIVGAFIITLSLLAYGIGSITLIRFKIVGSMVIIFLSLGVIFDIAAIIFMIKGSEGTPFTFHGLIGYTAFTVMLVDTFWVWVIYFKKGLDTPINKLHLWFARGAYFWWVLGYITGSLIVLFR